MALQIIKKHEQLAEEVAKFIFAIGLGHAAIAMNSKALVENASSDIVKLIVLALAAKGIGMARDLES